MKYKLCILMWYTDDIKKYANINYKINKLYCKKYDYDIIKSHERTYKNRKPHWERLPLLLKYIDKYDYIIWIDADAFFYKNAPPITNVIDNYPDKTFIFSGDSPKNDKINSGFFITKNNKLGKDILKLWAYSDDLYKKRIKPFQDQGVIRLIYKKNILNIKEHSKFITYGILQHYDSKMILKNPQYGLTNKPFVLHLTKFNKENRIKKSNKYYLKIILPKGSWIKSSKNHKINGDYLITECRNKKGKFVKNKIYIDDKTYQNVNGKLSII